MFPELSVQPTVILFICARAPSQAKPSPRARVVQMSRDWHPSSHITGY